MGTLDIHPILHWAMQSALLKGSSESVRSAAKVLVLVPLLSALILRCQRSDTQEIDKISAEDRRAMRPKL